MEFASPISALVSMAWVDASFDAEEQHLRTKTGAGDETSVAKTFEEGRSSVSDLATAGYQRTLEEFARTRSELEPDLIAEIGRRLAEVAKRLEVL